MSESIPFLSIPVVSLILVAGLFLTIRFRGVQFREFFLAWKVVSGMLDQPAGRERLTIFQTSLVAVSGMVGGSVLLSDTRVLESGNWLWLVFFVILYAPIQFSIGATASRGRSYAVLAAVILLILQGISQTAYSASVEMHLAWPPLAMALIVAAFSAALVFSPAQIGGRIFAWIFLAVLVFALRGAWMGGGAAGFPQLYLSTNLSHIASALFGAITLCELARQPFLFSFSRIAPARAGLVSLLLAMISPFVYALTAYIMEAAAPADSWMISIAVAAGLILWSSSWMWSLRGFLPGQKGTIAALAFAILPFVMQHVSYSVMIEIITFGAAAGGLAFAFLTFEAFTKSAEAEKMLGELRAAHRWELSKDIYLLFLTILPQNFLSRAFGWIAATPLPGFVREPILLAYSRAFGVTVEEAAREIKEYSSLNDFFTRYLKPGARPIEGDNNVIVSPVDGTVLRFGDIVEGQLIQAKAMEYSLRDLLEFSEYLQDFEGGKFLVIYLSPRDYHRIHFPIGGEVPAFSYSPGDLFTVNPMAVERLDALFAKNERLATFIQNPRGTIALIKVGATNVGRICLAYDSFKTNRWFRRPLFKRYSPPIFAKRGDELGRFEMGSTVILLFPHGKVEFMPVIQEKNKVKFGQGIAKWI